MTHLIKKDDQITKKLAGTLTAGGLRALVEERRKLAKTFLLLDYSGSMDEFVTARGTTRKIDALRQLVTDLVAEDNLPCPLVGFGASVGFITRIPAPGGGTPMAKAIDFAAGQGSEHLIVISDGIPDDRDAALRAAQDFMGPIDVFYVGPESDLSGADFMRRLASASRGGRVSVTTLKDTKQLQSAIRGLLAPGRHLPQE